MMETDTDSTIFSVASIEILISIKVTLPIAKELLQGKNPQQATH